MYFFLKLLSERKKKQTYEIIQRLIPQLTTFIQNALGLNQRKRKNQSYAQMFTRRKRKKEKKQTKKKFTQNKSRKQNDVIQHRKINKPKREREKRKQH
jgi:uncharacterized protein YacL